MVRTDCHTFDPLFNPPTSAQNPCFYQKLSPKVRFFSHCPEFWKFFTQRPLISWNLRKRYPNAPYFYGFRHWKTPCFLPWIHMFVSGECCSLKHSQKLENFVFSKQNRAIWWILEYKFNIGAENKISVLQAQPTQLCIMDEFHWRAGMIYRLLSP